MAWFLVLLCITIATAAALTLVGRLAVQALRVDALAGDEPEHWLGALLFGTGLITLLCGWCAYAGLGAREYRWLALLAIVALAGSVARRGEFRQTLRIGPGGILLVVAGVLVARVALYLLPAAFGGSHLLISDAMVYVPAADWLTGHGFTTIDRPNPEQPVETLMVELQKMNHRMGPIFLHSLLTATLPELGAFELFPVMIGLGVMLNLSAVYLLCRWCFHLPPRASALGLLLLALIVHTLGSSSSGTFLCQLFGTAVLGASIAVMTLLREPARWTGGNALLAGCLVSFQISMYSELAPVLAIAGLVWIACCAMRKSAGGQGPSFWRFLAQVVLAVVLVGNIELVRCWRGVMHMVHLNGVGTHIPWSIAQFGEFAVGGMGFDHRFGIAFRGAKHQACASVMILLAALGLRSLFERGGAFPAAALAVLLGLFAFFATCRVDPWTGQPGHTWNLFKIAKWAYPFVAALQIAGLARLAAISIGGTKMAPCVFALTGVVALFNLQLHLRAAHAIADQTRQFSPDQSPYDAARQLRQRLAEFGAPVYLIRRPDEDFRGPLLVSLLYPNPLRNSWKKDPQYYLLDGDLPGAFEPGMVYLIWGDAPNEATLERMPFQLARIDAERPVLFRIDRSSEQSTVTCWIFTKRPASVELLVEPGVEAIHVSVNGAEPDTFRSNHFRLRQGVNRVTLFTSAEPVRILGLKPALPAD